MGNNAAFTTFERITVGAYDLGKLDRDLLRIIMEANADCDIDWGGWEGLIAKDGLDITEIVVKTWHGKKAEKALERPKLPKDRSKWTTEQVEADSARCDKLHELFDEVSDQFGWC